MYFCVDVQGLYGKTMMDALPAPRIVELIDGREGAKRFSALEATSLDGGDGPRGQCGDYLLSARAATRLSGPRGLGRQGG